MAKALGCGSSIRNTRGKIANAAYQVRGDERGAAEFCPTGKPLLIFGNRVKPQNQKESKIFLFSFNANHFTSIAIPSREEGRIMTVTKRGMGCGGRW